MSIGRTEEVHESGDPDYLSEEELVALTSREKATVEGVRNDCEILKQKMETLYEKLDRMVRLYGTLVNRFDTFEAQRHAELIGRGTGPTEVEDLGIDDRPSTEASDDTAGGPVAD